MRRSVVLRQQAVCHGLIAAGLTQTPPGLTTAIRRPQAALSPAAARRQGISTRKAMATTIARKGLIEGRPTSAQEAGREIGHASRP